MFAHSEGTLYQRLGGADRIACIVDDAIDRHAVNPVLAPRLRGRDLPELKALGTSLVCAHIGGPPGDGPWDPRLTRNGVRVSKREYGATREDVVAALCEQGVADAEAEDVLALLDSWVAEILER